MDEKLERLASCELWQMSIEKFVDKGISPAVYVSLSNPEFRGKLFTLLENGTYRFDPPVVYKIPKDSGGFREIFVLNELDRCVMSLISDVYTEMYSYKIHPHCVSYRHGVGVPNILHGLCKKLDLGGYKVDLSKYFDSVSRERVNQLLTEMSTDSPIDTILMNFYNDDRIIVDNKITTRYRSLGQGVALGTLLANLCLKELDVVLDDMCDVYYRYCDDILLLGSRADEALEVLKERIAEFGLSLNPKKIEKITENSEFTFLGGLVHKNFVGFNNDKMKKWKKEIRKVVDRRRNTGRSEQKKAIRRLQKFLFLENEGHSRVEYIFSICTTDKEVKIFDEYAKDCIRAVYTGKHNYTTNLHKTSNSDLQEMGWCSLVHLKHLYNADLNVFRAKLKSVLNNGKSKFINRENQKIEEFSEFFQKIEELWEIARYSEKNTILYTQPDEKKILSVDDVEFVNKSLTAIVSLLTNTKVELNQEWIQSKKYPELVIFQEWFSE